MVEADLERAEERAELGEKYVFMMVKSYVLVVLYIDLFCSCILSTCWFLWNLIINYHLFGYNTPNKTICVMYLLVRRWSIFMFTFRRENKTKWLFFGSRCYQIVIHIYIDDNGLLIGHDLIEKHIQSHQYAKFNYILMSTKSF